LAGSDTNSDGGCAHSDDGEKQQNNVVVEMATVTKMADDGILSSDLSAPTKAELRAAAVGAKGNFIRFRGINSDTGEKGLFKKAPVFFSFS